MKEHPILFSGAMVLAILAGVKSQTRRIAKRPDRPCPYGIPGDRLWVRETWQHNNFPGGPYKKDCTVFYRADYFDDPHGPDGEKSPEGRYRWWSPAIHMPRSASRLMLEVTDTRLERLQAISEADAIAEGVIFHEGAQASPVQWEIGKHSVFHRLPPAVAAYRDLFGQINGKGVWDDDPLVWVVSFRRLDAASPLAGG